MTQRILTLTIAAGVGVAAPGQADKAFDGYPSEPALVGAPAAPQMTLPRARLYRTVLREAAVEGPNFNGHYRIVHWGCGTNCIEWAVLDLTDGRVWFAPDVVGSCWAPTEPANLHWPPDWFEAYADSSLFYLYECAPEGRRNRTFDQRRVFELRAGLPKLLRVEQYLAPNDAK